MSRDTSIEWCDRTFNPWWGCARVSRGCRGCYAETWAKRTGHDGLWRRHGPRRFFGDHHWKEPRRWDREAQELGRPLLVFCASMADVFEDHPALPDPRARLWNLIEETPHLAWLLLTKRPENVRRMVPWHDLWPPHVWIGTSVEHQEAVKERIPILLRIPAAVRFLSVEPLVGPVDLNGWIQGLGHRCSRCGAAGEEWEDQPYCRCCGFGPSVAVSGRDSLWPIDWIIAGGESGGDADPMDPAWPRAIRDQAVDAGVPYFFKQWGAWHPTREAAGPRGPVRDVLPMVRQGKHAPGYDEQDGRAWREWPPEAGVRPTATSRSV